MLIVNRQQLAAMDANRLGRFRRLVLAHVRQVLPQSIAGATEPELLQSIDGAIMDAREFGIVAERDVARYVALAFALGGDFADDGPTGWIGALLRDPTLDPTTRIDQLYTRLEPAHSEHGALWEAWRG